MEKTNIVNVLFDGYSRMSEVDPGVMHSNCTCTLIQTPSTNIIVDTMTPWNSSDILEGKRSTLRICISKYLIFNLKTALQKYSISADDVSYVVSTHGHSDHVGNNNLFLRAVHIVGHDISHKDEFRLHDFSKDPFNIADGVRVHATPGHTKTCVSVFVDNTNYGRVVIAGDLFEKREDIDDCRLWMEAGSENTALQRHSRNEVGQWANVIIPGHGGLFDVTEDIRKKLLLATTIV